MDNLPFACGGHPADRPDKSPADNHPDIKVCRLDVEEYPAFAGQYGIMMIPTTIAFKDGKKCKRATGLRRAGVLLSMVR